MRNNQFKARIKTYLLLGKKLTPMIALKRFGCFRLAVYIQRLRDEGMNIETERLGKQRYASYSLIKHKAA